MITKYETRVSSVGAEAENFAALGIFVLFGPSAPEELHDFAIITEESELSESVKPGDVVLVDDVALEVTGVGARANENISELGHLVVKLNGLTEVELPGDVSVIEQLAPAVNPGTVIKIEGTL